MLKEKRLSLRIPVMLKVDYKIGSKAYTGFSANMSIGGLFMNVNKPCEIGSKINMQFMLPGVTTPVSLEGRIVRVSTPLQPNNGALPGLGIQFSEIAKTNKELLDSFLKQYQEVPDSTLVYGRS